MNKLILNLSGKELKLPNFLPDATYGVVKSLDTKDLKQVGVHGLVVNTFHLINKPGISVIDSLNGIKNFMNWDGIILSDSGGFQIFSVLRENPKFGSINEDEIILKNNEKIIITPEKIINAQFKLKSDIMMALDYCTHPDDSYEINKLSVKLTIDWGKRSKKEYEKLIKSKENYKPLIFGIIQGGKDKNLRKECAEALMEIGFDGFGFGGYPIDSKGNLIEDILQYTAELIPDNLPKYAMGIGKPENIVTCAQMGYNLFDCVIPTREGRKGKLYIYNDKMEKVDIFSKDFYSNIFILDGKYVRDKKPISEFCDCLLCQNYSRAYLHHLFKLEDPLAYRLASIHNLRFYMQLIDLIWKKIS
ncbi:MAG: tRNA guanosine(34) transglycosylase Tgt [Dictyoglomus sp. NZ13-RE01]|nr:MAG: tRNA guanosine(34) transglycosylase Tgt [Dictyoglomus sp. NZ13-RE01]